MKTMLGMGAVGAPAAPASGVSPTWPDGPPAQPASGGTAPTWPGESPPAQAPAQAAGQHKTMLGMGAVPAPGGAPPAVPAASPAQGQPAGGLQRTMLGIAPLAPPAAGAGAPSAPSAPAAGAQHKTMLGIAPGQPGQPPTAAHPPASAAPGSSALPSQQKTMLGIAHPGIAPLAPTAPKSAPAAAPQWTPPPPQPAMPTAEDLSVLPGRQRRRVPVVALLAIAGFVVLLVGVVVIAVLWKGSGPVSAKVSLDAQNHEQLELGCKECPDGTQAALGKASTTFKSGHAVLPVDRPLKLGDNDLQIALTKPGQTRASTVDLTVPVDYRVRGDLSQLSKSPPALRVIVQATKGSVVSVDGKPLALAQDGTAHCDIDVSKQLSGAASGVLPLERKVAYSVKASGEKQADTGEVKFQLGIVPLVIDAPGSRIITDARTFMLAGHTEKGGSVSVGGRQITVDAQGSFAQLMNVSAVGQTTINVRASAKDRAPRLFPLQVKRVDSLAKEAATFEKQATQSYAGISSDIDTKKGWAVVLPGKVVESRVDHHKSYVLFDVSAGCQRAPCLARLVSGEAEKLAKGDKITAYGHITRGVDGPRRGTTIPEVDVDFLMKGPR